MTIKEKMHGSVAVVSLKGNMVGDPEDTDHLKEKVLGLFNEGFKRIVLDLGGVRFVSSAGLGAIISCFTSVKNKGGDLRLSNITEKVESLFVITQLVKVFKTYETTERAVASFK